MSWRKRKIGEFASIKHGWAFKGEYFSQSGKYILLTPGNAYETGGLKLRPGKEKFYIGDFSEEFLLKRDDMLVIMTDLIQSAPILGAAILIQEDDLFLHNQRIGLVEILPDADIDRGFLYYLFNSPAYRAQVRATATGATVRHTAPKRICDCEVFVPDSLEEQRQVAGTLSAYDDLIETNRRRIALLEEAARLLYREWFVNLRFPGYEQCKIVDGLPEGWTHGSAHDVVHVMSGGTPNTKTERFWNGDIPFFTPKDCSGSVYVLSTEKTLTEDGLDECNSRLFDKETIFITARGTVGKLALAQRPMAMNQSCYALAPKDGLNTLFLFLALEDGVAHLKGMASGGVFDTIIVDTFKFMPFVRPTLEVANQFGEVVRSVFDQIECLLVQNELLKQGRDDLLPKLMSGEIQP